MNEFPQRKQIRLKGFNYSEQGYYFVTICTQDMKCMFGNIVDNKMVLKTLPDRFPVKLDTYQIMPNHLHLIIAIVTEETEIRIPVGAGSSRPNNVTGSSRPTLGQIIGYFKYETTKQINNIVGIGFPDPPQTGAKTAPLQNIKPLSKIFQRNYYEHIIRNEEEYYKTIEYIELNPETWERDKNNPNHI